MQTFNDEDAPSHSFKPIDIYYLSTRYDAELKSHVPLMGAKLIQPISHNVQQGLHRPQNYQ